MNKYLRVLRRYENREPIVKTEDGTYHGTVFNGRFNGKGTFITNEGVILTGNWINGRINGKGVGYSSDGSYYKGNFRDGHCHGKGVVRNANGKIIRRGIWNNGEFVRDLAKNYNSYVVTISVAVTIALVFILLGVARYFFVKYPLYTILILVGVIVIGYGIFKGLTTTSEQAVGDFQRTRNDLSRGIAKMRGDLKTHYDKNGNISGYTKNKEWWNK